MSPSSYSFLRFDLGIRLMPLVAGLTVSGAVSLWTAHRLAARVRRLRFRPLGVRGTSELEFALAFPVFLISVLVTVQMALMVNANLVIDYAAYCAARSAAVWVPQGLEREPAYEIGAQDPDDSEKMDRIRRAATLAVTPISPRFSAFRFGITKRLTARPLDGLVLARLAAQADREVNAHVDYVRLGVAAADKWLYATLFTDVALVDGAGDPISEFSGTVTARVTHKFDMSVPFAGALIGAAFGNRYIPLVGGYYVPITASYTLMMAPS